MTDIDTAALPSVVSTYLDWSHGSEPGAAITLFAPTATVSDNGTHYSGRKEVLDFLQRTTAEFEYTTTLIGAEQVGHVATAINRLEGNFPGKVVELRYRFTLNDGETAIDQLDIS